MGNTTDHDGAQLPVFRWLDAFWKSGCDSGTGFTLLALWKFADNHKLTARPSRETLAAMTGTSVRSIERHITHAAEYGWVDRVERGFTGRNTQYQLTFGTPFPAKGATRGTQSKSEERAADGTQSATEGVTDDTQSPEECAIGDRECATGVAPTALRTTHRTASSASGADTGEGEDREHCDGPKASEPESASNIVARGFRNVAEEHVAREHYRFLDGRRIVRNDYADKLSPTKQGRIQGDNTAAPRREDFPDVSDENYRAAETKNLIAGGWLARKQSESLRKDNPARWLAGAISSEPARDTAPRRRFQEI